MLAYVLILTIWTNSGVSVTTAEFGSMELCQAAATRWEKQIKAGAYGGIGTEATCARRNQ